MVASLRNWRAGLLPKRLGPLIRIAFLLFTLACLARWLPQAIPRYLPKDWASAHEFDGLQDFLAARVYLQHLSPYSPEGLSQLHVTAFGHPPTTPFWFIAVARLDKSQVAELLSLSTWLFLLIHVYVCAKEVAFPAPVTLAVLVFGWALTTDGFVLHWHLLQLSEQIALPLALSWASLRRGRDVTGGVWLGVAATFKLFPGLIFLVLLLHRRFLAFFAAVATFGTVAAIMTARFGLRAWSDFFTQQGPVAQYWVGSIRNASLQGVITRVLSPICEAPAVPTTRSTVVASGIALALIVAGSVATIRVARTAAPDRIDLPFSLFTVLAVLCNPWVWEHYWVLLIQPAFVVMAVHARALAQTLEQFRAHPRRRLVLDTAWVVATGIGVAAIAYAVGSRAIRPEMLQAAWPAHRSAWLHRQLHWHEAFGFAPYALSGILCLAAVLRAHDARLVAPLIRSRRARSWGSVVPEKTEP